MNKFGICTWNLGLKDLKEIFEKVKSLGLDGMHFCEDINNYDPNEVKKYSKEYGLEIFAIDPFNCKPKDEENASSKLAIDFYKQMIDFAVSVESAWVTLQGLSTWTKNCKTQNEAWARLVECIKALDSYAKERNIKLIYEVCNKYEVPLINSAKELNKLLDEINSDNVYIVLDSFHMHIEENDQIKAIKDCSKRLISYQISDSTRGGIGSGTVNYFEHHKALKEIGFNNPIVLEVILPHLRPTGTPNTKDEWDGLEMEVKRSVDIWKTMDKYSIYERE